MIPTKGFNSNFVNEQVILNGILKKVADNINPQKVDKDGTVVASFHLTQDEVDFLHVWERR